MRWLVEVVTLGKTETEALHVDAESWQKALQAARTQRGETAPMSGFSIELLDDGCRAVDPMARLRYDVRRSPEPVPSAPPPPVVETPSVRPPADGAAAAAPASSSAPATVASTPTATSPPTAPTSTPSANATASATTPAAQRPSPQASTRRSGQGAASSQPTRASQAPKSASTAPRPGAAQASRPAANAQAGGQTRPVTKRPTVSAATMSAVGATETARTLEPAPAPLPPPAVVQMPTAAVPVAPVATAAPMAEVSVGVTAPAPAAAPRTDVELSVPSQIIFKREHDATDAQPLTYREYVFLVPPGTTEQNSEALLRTQLELVLASLGKVPAGKLVNLAAFDATFQGKPSSPPLVTLMWKDWRGAPVVEFPRRPGYAPVASLPPSALMAQPLTPVSPASQPPHTMLAAAAPAPVPLVVPTPVVPVTVPAEAREPEEQARQQQEEVVTAPPPPATTGAGAAGQPVVAAPRSRVRGEDLIADLFESMHELHFLRDAVEAGDFCLSLAMEKIPSQAGIVHLYDIDRREFLVTSTRGVAASTLLLRRHDEKDALLSSAMVKRRALVIADATEGDAAALERYVALGGAHSLIIAPVMQAGRFLGAIELLNPLDGQPFTDAEGNAVTYIAEQFAEFVATRGVVTDPERIRSRVGG